MKRLLPLLLIALAAGACGPTTPSESPSPSLGADATFNTNFAVWGLEKTLPASWTPSSDGETTYNTWTPIASDLVVEKVYSDEGMEYIFPSNYCQTDQMLAGSDRLAGQDGMTPPRTATQWLACATVRLADVTFDYSDEVALAIYTAGTSRLNAFGATFPATCAAFSVGDTIPTTFRGEDGEGGVVTQEAQVPLSPFETTLFGLKAYGYSVRLQSDLFEATRYIEVCAQKGDRILVLMTRAAVDVEEPFDDEGNELPLPFAQLKTAYGPTPVWAELANATPALVNP